MAERFLQGFAVDPVKLNALAIARTKLELGPALAKLKKWIATTIKAKRSLALILDGDQ